MPVTATPFLPPDACCDTFPQPNAPAPTPLDCAGQSVLVPAVSTIYQKPIPGRLQSVNIVGGQKAVISWQMKSQTGQPVNLDCLCVESGSIQINSASSEPLSDNPSPECPYGIKFRIREYLGGTPCSGLSATEYDVVVTDKNAGLVQVTLPPADTTRPGIFYGEIAVVGFHQDGTTYPIFSNSFMVIIGRGNWSMTGQVGGPPSIAEVRLHLRDSGPEESTLLDNVAFDDAEIGLAIVRPVQQWNETPPPIQTYTTDTFPFRFHWLEAICGNLFLMVAEQQRRNNLEYSAAGVTINDNNREPNYERAAAGRLAVWNKWLKDKKVSMNLMQGFAEVGSPYGSDGAGTYGYGPW